MAGSRERWILALSLLLVASHRARAEGFLTDREVARFVETGNGLFRAGKLDEAEKAYTEALTLRPGTPEVLRNLGHTFYRKSDFARAQEFYDKARAAQDGPSLLHDQANTAFQQGKLDEAIQMYRQVLKEDPLHMDAKYNLEVATARKEEQQKQEQDSKDDKQKDEEKKDDKDKEEKKDDKQKDDKDKEEKQDKEKKDEPKQDEEKKDDKQKDEPKQDEEKKDDKQKDEPKQDEESGKGDAPQPSPSPEPSPAPSAEPSPAPSPASPEQEMIDRTLDGLREDEKQTLKEALRRMVPRSQEPVTEYDW